jgi:hypothetical protein
MFLKRLAADAEASGEVAAGRKCRARRQDLPVFARLAGALTRI